jgi:hypothetical protein
MEAAEEKANKVNAGKPQRIYLINVILSWRQPSRIFNKWLFKIKIS